jgi:hypothetical protein
MWKGGRRVALATLTGGTCCIAMAMVEVVVNCARSACGLAVDSKSLAMAKTVFL